jgi:hypothetical protein
MKIFSSCAPKTDLVDVLDLQQALAHLVGVLLQLFVGEAVAGECIDRAVHIAELVVEERSDHAARQGAAHVVDLLAHRVPDLLHLLRGRRILHLEDDQRFARLGVAADLVGVGHLLQRLLELVGHLVGHLLRRGARPEHAHHHRTEGERRVFVLPQLEVGRHAQHQQHQQQIAGQRRVFERPAGDVEALGAVRGLGCG